MAYAGARLSDDFPPPQYQAAPLLYSASPTLLQPQPQPQPPAPSFLLPSSYAHYSTPIAPNPNPNPNYSAPYPAPLLPPGVGPHLPLGVYNATQPAPYAYPTASVSVGNFMTQTAGGLDRKMQKVIEEGAAADSVKVCIVCNVVCNSDKVFASHLAGSKHAMKALGTSGLCLSAQGLPRPWVNKVKKHQAALPVGVKPLKRIAKVVKSVYCDVCKIECNSQEIYNNHKMGKKHVNKLQNLQESFAPIPKPSKRIVEVVKSVYCDVCKITCNNQEILDKHKMGKKHKGNLQKLQESLAPKPMDPPTLAAARVPLVAEVDKALSEKAQKRTDLETKEDLETKTRKMIEGGTAADAVRICILCNVACNSDTVFKYHILGQRHTNMLKKQEGAAIS